MHALRTLWTDKPFWRKLWTLAVPIIIQNFINSSLNMVAVSYTHLDVYKRQVQAVALEWRQSRLSIADR